MYNRRQYANFTAVDELYLRAAGLHLRLAAFFDSPSSKDYRTNLLALWFAAVSFLESAFDLQIPAGSALVYVTNYILQMVVAAGFTLLKLLNSFFANYIDLERGRRIFNRTIFAIRSISVASNDLPSRLAEVLAQLWRGSGAGLKIPRREGNGEDSSLQLKVKCRMSMSLVYDSVWRWREEFQAKGRGNLECQSPTYPHHLGKKTIKANQDSSRTHQPHESRFRHGKFLQLHGRYQPGPFGRHDGHGHSRAQQHVQRIQLRDLGPLELDVGRLGRFALLQHVRPSGSGRGRARARASLELIVDDIGLDSSFKFNWLTHVLTKGMRRRYTRFEIPATFDVIGAFVVIR